jgi:Zn-dependent protease with chaperone function
MSRKGSFDTLKTEVPFLEASAASSSGVEFAADAFAARAMGSPDPMASALRRLARENWLDDDKLDAGALAAHPTIRRRLLMLPSRRDPAWPSNPC